MSHLKFGSNKKSDQIGDLVNEMRSTISNQGSDFASPVHADQIISVESLNARDADSLNRHVNEVMSQIGQSVDSIGLESFKADTDAGLRARNVGLAAGAVVAMAAGNPGKYAAAALKVEATAPRGGQLATISNEGMDYRDQIANEAFDTRELTNFMPYSIAFNVFASRQDDFSEAFFPTTVVTPDQAGVDVSVARVTVFSEFRHAVSGKQLEMKKRNLIDAAVDPTILADESIRLIPHRAVDDSNADMFIAEASHPGAVVKVSGIDVPSAPLATDKTIDIIGLSAYAPLLSAGVYDNSDSLDAKLAIDGLYLIPAAGEKAVKFSTAGVPRSSFVKSAEGNGREMVLNFKIEELVLNAATRAIDGTAVTAFAAIASNNWTVRLGTMVSGDANVESGNVTVHASKLSVQSILDNTGAEVSMTAGAGATLKAALEAMVIAGYDLRASRTNSNRRSRGLMLDTTYEVERYTIPLGAPISVPAPASGQDETGDLKALVAAARQRNSNNAVTQLFAYGAQLKTYVSGPRLKDRVPAVQGMGRYLVRPFYEEHTLDLEASLNSLSTHEKAADVSAVLVNAIRDIAYRMYRDSRIQAALDQATGGSGETPVLTVGTDQVLVRHLMVSGDTRTFGTVFDDARVVASMDSRMRNKIVLAFQRKATDGADPLSFGTHAWIPELTSSMVVNRNGGTIKETMVQPRTLHFNNCPVMAVIDVQNLSKVLADKIVQGAVDADTSNPYLTGFMTA